MSSTNVVPANAKDKSAVSANQGPAGIERRRRRRAKISAQLRVEPTNSPAGLEEICTTVDVSRDGLLFVASRAGYVKGQSLDVTFPYSSGPNALNQSQPAEVVRVAPHEGKFAVAVQFIVARTDSASEKKRGYSAHAAGPTAEHLQQPRQSTVLAVESDVRVADMMRNVLSQDGYTVVIVKTAKEALDFLRANVPDVFIAEVECEEISGHDLCAIVKRSERLQRVPVILLTRAAQPADYSASHQMGAVVCMAKPFQPDRLAHVVRLVAPPPTTKSFYGARVSGSVDRNL
ncbi:MAG TPA: response regulator [Candidatus Baltobacteraceae bacterium]|jgi:CheY-like chemotaxis protein|nr:response regulator [Candidatus Baltobacteraceae bacterium]